MSKGKLSDEQVREVCRAYAEGERAQALAARFCVNISTIYHAIKRGEKAAEQSAPGQGFIHIRPFVIDPWEGRCLFSRITVE